MTNYVTCPWCGRQTTARKAGSHQRACRKRRLTTGSTVTAAPVDRAATNVDLAQPQVNPDR